MLTIVKKSYEDSYMRKFLPEEIPCDRLDSCEGRTLRLRVPELVDESETFVLPRFILPNGTLPYPDSNRCVLCIRRSVTEKWIECHSDGRGATEVLQPWINLVDVAGEYEKDVCIVPFRSSPYEPAPFCGFTDPFVRYNSLYYRYEDGAIKQRNVERREIRYLKPAIPNPGAKTFEYSWKSRAYRTDDPLVRKHLNEYRKRGENDRVGLDKIYDVSFCVLLSGILICKEESKPLPIAEKMFRAAVCKNPKMEVDDWTEKLILASKKGVYPFCEGGERDFDEEDDREAWALLAVRENLIFWIESDAVYRESARKKYGDQWIRFVTETVRIANEFRKNGPSVVSYGECLVNLPKKCFWSFAKKMFEKQRPAAYEGGNRRNDGGDRGTLSFEHVEAIAVAKRKYEEGASSGAIWNSIKHSDENTFEALRAVVMSANDRVIYRTVKAPLHAIVRNEKHDYVCKSCDKFKGVIVYSPRESEWKFDAENKKKKKKKQKSLPERTHMLGQRDISLNLETGERLCFKKKAGGRAKENAFLIRGGTRDTASCNALCERIVISETFAHVNNQLLIRCRECGVVCFGTAERIFNGGKCGRCGEIKETHCCVVCFAPKKPKAAPASWTSVTVFRDGGRSPCKNLWVCRRHYMSFMKECSVWSEPELLRLIDEKTKDDRGKKRAKGGQRSA